MAYNNSLNYVDVLGQNPIAAGSWSAGEVAALGVAMYLAYEAWQQAELSEKLAEAAEAALEANRAAREEAAQYCESKSAQSKPKDAPSGTRPIDDSGQGLGRGEIHDIKDGVGAGPTDWTGIAPNGDVITSNPDGNHENHGPYTDYLP
jgi:type II secretory pathway pseudopilin PulG